MGRIKTQQIKSITHKLLLEHPDRFKDDFKENKGIVSEVLDVKSKKLRNTIAGYATRITRSNKEIN